MMNRFQFVGFRFQGMKLSQKSKNFNLKGRREITQSAQDFEFQLYILCDLCVKTLRLCGKKTFETASALQSKIVNQKS